MKKVLSQAIAAATIMGAATAAQAVQVSHGGEGQALLYPYYSVENGNYTALHLTNTTDEFKAVKVRFRRYTDSADSLDFNLYLSPEDMWTGAVVMGDKGPKLVSTDTSCISAFPEGMPANGVDFGVLNGSEKGHIEIIEMASWTDGQAAAANVQDAAGGKPAVTVKEAVEHIADKDGVRKPGNCAAINATWKPSGKWAEKYQEGVNKTNYNPDTGELDTAGTDSFEDTNLGYAPTGGLYGNVYVINPDEAWASSYAPVALNDLYPDDAGNNHHAPRYGLPDLQGGVVDIAKLVIANPDNPNWPSADAQIDGLKGRVIPANNGMADFAAIQDSLLKKTVKSDFTIGGASEASTELVLTFPLKYAGSPWGVIKTPKLDAYGNPMLDSDGQPEYVEKPGPVDVTVGAIFYDREEDRVVSEEEDWQLSPWLPGMAEQQNKLVHETNVLNLGEHGEREDIGAHTISLNSPFGEGWVDIDFTYEGEDGEKAYSVPVIGFTSTVVKNKAVLASGTNTYALNFPLKYTQE